MRSTICAFQGETTSEIGFFIFQVCRNGHGIRLDDWLGVHRDAGDQLLDEQWQRPRVVQFDYPGHRHLARRLDGFSNFPARGLAHRQYSGRFTTGTVVSLYVWLVCPFSLVRHRDHLESLCFPHYFSGRPQGAAPAHGYHGSIFVYWRLFASDVIHYHWDVPGFSISDQRRHRAACSRRYAGASADISASHAPGAPGRNCDGFGRPFF